VSHFDSFFRANYLRMVRYCMGFGHIEQDVEEQVSDVIYRHYDEFREKITGPAPDDTLRHWMNRRVLLNLGSARVKRVRQKTDTGHDVVETMHFDDPEALLQLKQQLPPVHPILIEYEPHGGSMSARGENTNADKTRFCRERKKFMAAFHGIAP
jgi:hypothetical protein